MISRAGRALCIVLSLLIPGISALAQSSERASGNASELLTPTPPMGWNSWDSFGTTVTEADTRAAADVMHAKLQPFGWRYITVDMEWSTANPTATGGGADQRFTMDEFGRYTPALNRFPSAAEGKGFGPLAAYVHSLGLKFGIHVLQGIPREAVLRDLPIQGSAFHAAGAANTMGVCGWNPDNYDLKETPAAQAYYDSLARLYASWKVDLVKVDCITEPQYKGAELRMLHAALRKVDYPVALSLSPGEPPIDFADEFAANAEQWRISNDVWDVWRGTATYPQGAGDQFARTSYWLRTQKPGHWPDADMIPLGSLTPAPGWGPPRETRLTHAEQRTLVTLWSVFRSPLIFGGNLTKLDDWTLSLLTNPEVLAVDQHASENHPALTRPDVVVWTAMPQDKQGTVVAVFNQKNTPATIRLPWVEVGLTSAFYTSRDLWTHKDVAEPQRDLTAEVEAHGCVLLLVKAVP